MYTYYDGKDCIFLWCDGKEQEVSDESAPKKKTKRDTFSSKRAEREEELEDTFQTLKKKHGNSLSAPQIRLWARMIVAGTHNDTDVPPNVPMIKGVPRQTHKESLTDVVSSAAAAIAKALTPPSTPTPTSNSTLNSPNKTVDTRMKNLEQLKCLQQLREEGVLTEKVFLTQKQIVLQSLNRLV